MYLLLSSFLLFALCSSCSVVTKNNQSAIQSKSILLLHGAHLDGASWGPVKKELEEQGFLVNNPDLPGRGPNKNVDLNDYSRLACESAGDETIVVAHSQSGAVVNQMVGICPDKIVKIIYVTALVPLNGEAPFELVEKRDEKVYSKIVFFKDDRIEPKNKRGFVRNLAPDFDMKTMRAPHFYGEPRKLAKSILEFKSDEFDNIPKAYVITKADQILTPQTQQKYIDRIGISEIYDIESGHLPFITKSKELADIVIRSSNL